MKTPPHKITITSPHTGPNLAILAQIHGNEPCGALAINQLLEEINTGQLILRRGQLTIIPCCNPGARALNTRYIDKNLNRVFKKHPQPKAYEEKLANKLVTLIGKPDFLLDLHSFHTVSHKPITFSIRADNTPLIKRVADKLPVNYCLNHWKEVQTTFGRPQSFSTIDHIRRIHKSAIGVECGQHDDPSSRLVAYECIRQTMSVLGICDYKKSAKAQTKNLFFKHLEVYQDGGVFLKKWKEFERVKKGQPIAKLISGKTIVAPITGRLIFPNAAAKKGEEWFYIAK